MQELASFLCVIDISASIHPSKQTARLRWWTTGVFLVGARHSPDLTGGGVRSSVPRSFYWCEEQLEVFSFLWWYFVLRQIVFLWTYSRGHHSRNLVLRRGRRQHVSPHKKRLRVYFAALLSTVSGDFRCVCFIRIAACWRAHSFHVTRREPSRSPRQQPRRPLFCVKVILLADVSVFSLCPPGSGALYWNEGWLGGCLTTRTGPFTKHPGLHFQMLPW